MLSVPYADPVPNVELVLPAGGVVFVFVAPVASRT